MLIPCEPFSTKKSFNFLLCSPEHLKYPIVFEPDKQRHIKQIKAHNQLNKLKKNSTPQTTGVTYKETQKILLSMVDCLTSCSDSYIHSSVPSSFTSFHHLSPTKNRPEIFLTYQKSNAANMIIKTNERASPNSNLAKKYL